jgi:hypothetical protein
MTTIKRVFLAVLLILGAVSLGTAGAWLLVDDETLLSLLVKRLETASDTRISYREGASISRTWKPELSVNNLVVADREESYRLETSSLRLKVSLPSLLTGRLLIPHLLLGDTDVHILKSAASDLHPADEQPGLDLATLRLRPVLRELEIAELSIFLEGDEVQLPATRVTGLSLGLEPVENNPVLSAEVEVEGERFTIDANLPDFYQGLKQKRLPFSLSVKGDAGEASAVGQVDFAQPAAVLQAELHGRFPELSEIPGVDRSVSVPGELTAAARVDGSFAQLAAEDVSLRWVGPGQSDVKLDGRIANVVELDGVELAVAGRLAQAGWLTPLLPDSVGALAAAELAARVSGDRSKLRLDDVSLKASSAEGLDLSLSGGLDLAQPLQALKTENLDLKLVFSAPTTRAARVLIFDAVPELGAINGSADVRSTSGDPGLEDIDIRTQDEKGIQVALKGRIAQFPLSDAPNTGYDLDVSMKATQTSVMAERAGMELPLVGPLDLSYRIQGDTQALELNQVKLSAGDKHKTLIGAEGRIHFGDWDQPDPIASMDLAVRMSGRDTGFLSAWTEQDFPPTAYQSQGRLHTVDGQHRIDDFRMVTPPGEPLDVWEKGSADKVTFLPEFSIEGIRIDPFPTVCGDSVAALAPPLARFLRRPRSGS